MRSIVSVAALPPLLAAAGLALLLAGGPAGAQDCKPDDVIAAIDRTGQRLRELNGEWEPRLRSRLRELAMRNGWSEADIDSRGRAAVEDEATRSMDARAAELLSDLDRLADTDQGGKGACARLDEARTKGAQLVEVSAQRNAHAIARIEVALRPPATAQPQGVPTAAATPSPVQPVPPAAQPPARAPAPPAKAKAAPPSAWDTKTVRDAEPSPVTIAAMPPPVDPGALGYSPEEIRAAGRGIFGTISAGLASVIDFAFQSYGRPTGYVLGDEGGGAFLAGLRYGEGRLVTKLGGDRKVYWQGPSAGFDFGVAGSRVMFLVYNIDEHEQVFQRFSGVDGSAYLVGGVGITILKRGKVILAPIRTGLGLRVGASLGYLKFTPTPSLNPF